MADWSLSVHTVFNSSLEVLNLSSPLEAFSWNKNIPMRRCFRLRKCSVVDASATREIR